MSSGHNGTTFGEDRSLCTLLSQVLLAFTIEFDNEFERRIAGAYCPRFLVSQAMWANFMRFVTDDGIFVHQISALVGLPNRIVHPSLRGMDRWGYVKVTPDPANTSQRQTRADWIVRPTKAGHKAQAIWRNLGAEIEDRWRARFGSEAVHQLCASLRAIVDQIDMEMPQYLPVLGFGMFATTPINLPNKSSQKLDEIVGHSLSVLLVRALMAFTLDFERDSRLSLSLAISANVIRVLSEEPVPIRELPHRTGVSKEAISMSLTYLRGSGHVVVAPHPENARTPSVRLTGKGVAAQSAYLRALIDTENQWKGKFGTDNVIELRRSLETLMNAVDGPHSRLSEGLKPYPEGWRARKPYLTQTEAVLRNPHAALAHYPMVLHRGGWPDGS